MTRVEREVRRRNRKRIDRLNKQQFSMGSFLIRTGIIFLAILAGIAIWIWAAEMQARDVQAAVLRAHRITDGPLYGPQVTMVEPLPDIPPVDGEPPQAIEIKYASKADAISESNDSNTLEEHWESLGRFKCTFYCSCRKCSGKWGHSTASGARCEEGITIAVDPKVIPLGTEVMIDGIGVRIAQDTGVKGRWIDVFMESHSECLQNGVQYHEVLVKR